MTNDKYTRDAYIEAYQGPEFIGWLLWLFKDDQLALKCKIQSRSLAELIQQSWVNGKLEL